MSDRARHAGLLRYANPGVEIDGGDPFEPTGWKVIIVGKPEEVTDRAEIVRLEDLELEPWASGAMTHWVRIPATSASSDRPHIRSHA